MRTFLSNAFILFALFAGANTSPLSDTTVCEGQIIVEESYIGKDHNVKMEIVTCPHVRLRPREVLEERQTNVCSPNCTTNCFLPAGGGPDPNQCHVIADALRFNSENTGALFPVGTGTNNTVVLKYQSCLSMFVNQDPYPVNYCRTNWADILDSVALNCQAPQNAHGGNCVPTDQQWFIQYVLHI